MKTEQIQQIVDGAKDNDFYGSEPNGFDTDDGGEYLHIGNVHAISDLEEILALRQQLEKCERRVIKNSKQRQRWKKIAEQAERERDELAAHVELLRDGFLDLDEMDVDSKDYSNQLWKLYETATQTPTQSLEALKLEQQAKGVEDFAQKLEDSSKDIPLGAEHRGRGSSTYNWQMYYKGAALNFADQLRNQAKEQE